LNRHFSHQNTAHARLATAPSRPAPPQGAFSSIVFWRHCAAAARRKRMHAAFQRRIARSRLRPPAPADARPAAAPRRTWWQVVPLSLS
jgi:hypothetical protein